MAESVTTLEEKIAAVTDKDIQAILWKEFEEVCLTSGPCKPNKRILEVLDRAMSDPDMSALVPELVDILYLLYAKREVPSRAFMNSTLRLNVNHKEKRFEPQADKDIFQINPNTLKPQVFRLKEIITDELIFI